jgi:hypothetical protein
VKKLTNSYLFFAIAFFLVAYQLLSQQRIDAFAERAELLVDLVNWETLATDELSRSQLFQFTRQGQNVARHLSDQYVLPTSTQYQELGFVDEIVSGGSIASLELRSHPRIDCNILFIEREIEGRYAGFAPTMAGDRWAYLEPAYAVFFDASDCVAGFRGELSGLIIRGDALEADGADHFFVLPLDWVKPLPHLLFPDHISEPLPFSDPSGQIEQSRSVEAALFPPLDDHIMVSDEALRAAIARAFSDQTGGRYTGSDLNAAIDDLFEQTAENANFAGINAPLSFILHLGPIFLLFVLWQLHRAIEQFDDSEQFDTYWVIKDTRDVSGLLVASAYSLLPYLFSVLMAIVFCSAVALWGIYFGYLLRFDNEMNLVLEEAPPIGWLRGQWMVSIAVAMTWVLHMLLAMKVSLGLLGLVLKSRQSYG